MAFVLNVVYRYIEQRRVANMNNRCYDCRAAEPTITAKYGGEILYRCTLHRDPDVCRKKIRTYAELFAAEAKERENT